MTNEQLLREAEKALEPFARAGVAFRSWDDDDRPPMAFKIAELRQAAMTAAKLEERLLNE